MVMTLRNRTLTDANDNTTKEEVTIDANHNNEEKMGTQGIYFYSCCFQDYKADKTLKDSPPKDRTTLVVFIGLLIDLLGKQRNEQPLLI